MTKDDLKKIIRLDRLIQSRLNEVEKMKKYCYQLSAVSYDSTKVQTSTLADPTAEAATKIVDRLQELMKRIDEEIDTLVDMKRAAEIKINAIEDTDVRLILTMRYLEGLPWNVIADRAGYSIQHVWRLHGKGLTKICDFKRRDNESA